MVIKLHRPEDEGPSDALVYAMCIIAAILLAANIFVTLSYK